MPVPVCLLATEVMDQQTAYLVSLLTRYAPDTFKYSTKGS